MRGFKRLCTVLFVLAGLVGKIVGCGAVIKAKKGSWREAGIAGAGMMARGEVALIVTTKGIEAGIIPDSFMIMTVMLILVSSVLTPVLLKALFSGHRDPSDGPEPSEYRGSPIVPGGGNATDRGEDGEDADGKEISPVGAESADGRGEEKRT